MTPAAHSRPPIFVVGYMHSGTTLLLNVLKNNSSVFSPLGETKFFDFSVIIQNRFRGLQDDTVLMDFVVFVVDTISSGFAIEHIVTKSIHKINNDNEQIIGPLMDFSKNNRDYGSIFCHALDLLTNSSGKERWVEKTPSHIFHINDIVKAVPNALFVEIVRDPRDILASKKTRQKTVLEHYEPNRRFSKYYEKSYDPLWDTLSWKAAIRAGIQAKEALSERVFTLRYEDLVSLPDSTVHMLCQNLGMDYQDRMLNVPPGISADSQRARSGGIHHESVGRWRSTLLPEETVVCEWLANSEMVTHGYAPTAPKARGSAVVKLLSRSSVEFSMRLYHRWKSGGLLYLSNVIFNYGKRLFKLIAP